MLLQSSLFIVLLITLFTQNIYLLLLIASLALGWNLLFNKKIGTKFKSFKFIFLIYLTTILAQLFLTQEGAILWKIGPLYITKFGIFTTLRNFLRVVTIVFLSWILNTQKILRGPLKRYSEIMDVVMEVIPEVFVLVKRKMGIKKFFRHIIKQIESKI